MPRSLPPFFRVLRRLAPRRLTPRGLSLRPLRRRKVLVPAVLAALGLVLLLVAIGLYPSQGQPPGPPYSFLKVITSFPVAIIEDSPVQLTPTTAEIKVTLRLPLGTQAPPPGSPPARVVVAPPDDVRFVTCPSGCQRASSGSGETWTRLLEFRPGQDGGQATAVFPVRARSLGVAANGLTAAAALPDVRYQGPGTPALVSSFVIPSGSSYDWSSNPQVAAIPAGVVFQEDITGGVAAGRDAVGINHAAQADQGNRTFVAGVLLGLAGGALLGAVQEALHAAGPASD
jgi:hypothetical protein